MNPTILGVIGPGFLNQVPTLLRVSRASEVLLYDETSNYSEESTPCILKPSTVSLHCRAAQPYKGAGNDWHVITQHRALVNQETFNSES